jgi:hypothetical protein
MNGIALATSSVGQTTIARPHRRWRRRRQKHDIWEAAHTDERQSRRLEHRRRLPTTRDLA